MQTVQNSFSREKELSIRKRCASRMDSRTYSVVLPQIARMEEVNAGGHGLQSQPCCIGRT